MIRSVERTKGGIVEVELLRPATDFQQYKPGDRLPIFMEEIGELDGWATIHSIMPYQTPAEGHGNVVTGRFKTRLVTWIKQVWLSNRESFAGTASHPVWVCNREEFVRLDELQVGDELDTLDGTSKVVRNKSISTRQDVYNIEVDREHVYRIGTTGVLVHNVGDDDCPLVNIGHAPNSAGVAADAAKGFENLQCKECVEAITKAMKDKGVSGEIIDVTTDISRPNIFSDRFGGVISQNGTHQAVRVGDTVFDNLNPNGIPYAEWLKDLQSVHGLDIKITPF